MFKKLIKVLVILNIGIDGGVALPSRDLLADVPHCRRQDCRSQATRHPPERAIYLSPLAPKTFNLKIELTASGDLGGCQDWGMGMKAGGG